MNNDFVRWGWPTSLLIVVAVSLLLLIPTDTTPVTVGTQVASGAETMSLQPMMTRLVEVRAASHRPANGRKYDRVVFEFDGPRPDFRMSFVDRLISDGSGFPVPVAGKYILQVTLLNTVAHTDQGFPLTRYVFNSNPAFLNFKGAVRSGDFEGVVTYGIGLDHIGLWGLDNSLTNKNRLVIDFVE